MRRLAVILTLPLLTSCGFNLLDPVGDGQRRHEGFAREAIADAHTRCGTDEACFKATANALYRHAIERDNAMWDAVSANTAPVYVPAYRPVTTPATMPYASSAQPVATTNTCSMMSCAPPPAPPVRFIPYTPGGGNPSGYGLLAR